MDVNEIYHSLGEARRCRVRVNAGRTWGLHGAQRGAYS